MPPKSRRPAKKHALTLAQLASYDDILTDALVDHVYYWTAIPKNRPSYLPSRGVKEEEITRIIQTHLIVEPDMDVAEEKLLATNGLGKFYRALRTDDEKNDFRRHMRRYMQIYLPDCPYEVASTNRYTIFQQEASIAARRFIKSNETIKYLSGIQVVITPEEEAQLSERKKDFSIVISSRKKEVNLFMGPARFANHDCDANARLVTTGQSGIEIIATKPIGVGDEITVTYGDNYFGDNNCECLCKTCEDHLTNGWAPVEGAAPVKQSIEDAATPTWGYSLRRRDENASSRGRSETPSLTPIARPKVRRTKLRVPERTGDSAFDSEHARQASLATPPVTPAKRQKATVPPTLSPIKREDSSSGSTPIAQSIEVAHEDACIHGRILTPESTQGSGDSDSEGCIVAARTDRGEEVLPTIVVAVTGIVSLPTPEASTDSGEDERPASIAEATVRTESGASTPGPGEEAQDGKEADPALTDEADTDTPAQAKRRVPGDYTLTPLLLSEPETAWVFCTVCSKAFVQRDAYYTRMSCPRCERHSKLYGYLWPKTEPEGKSDKEERILDHRLVHRFLDPDDEAKARGRKRAAGEMDAAETRPRRKRWNGETDDQTSLGSGIWRKLKYMKPKEAPKSKARSKAKTVRSRQVGAADS